MVVVMLLIMVLTTTILTVLLVGQVVRQMFRIFGLNRARQRRKLGVSFADWAILQQEASRLDQQLYQAHSPSSTPRPLSILLSRESLPSARKCCL